MVMLQLWISETPISLFIVLATALGFFIYGLQVFLSPFTKREFQRFGMTVFQRNSTGLLQILGAIALVCGIVYPVLGFMAALGFTMMMCAAMLVRIKLRDTIVESLPALVLLVSNIWLCFSFYWWASY